MIAPINQRPISPPPPLPVRPIVSHAGIKPTLPIPAKTVPAQRYAANWNAPTSAPTPAPAPAPKNESGIGGFLHGVASSAADQFHAVTTSVGATTSALGQVGGQFLRSSANLASTTVQAGASSFASRVSGAVSVVSAEVHGAGSVVGSAVHGAASITGSFVTGVGKVALAGAFDPTSVPAAAAQAANDLRGTVTAAGSDLASKTVTAGAGIVRAADDAQAHTRATDARGATNIASSIANGRTGLASSVLGASRTLAVGGTEALSSFVRGAQTLGATVSRAGSDLLGVTKAVVHSFTQPFDFSYHPSSPVSAPGGLGTQVGGNGTPQDVYENTVAAGNSYNLPVDGKVGIKLPDNMHVLDVQNSPVAAREVQNQLGLTPQMLEGGSAVPGFRAQVYRTDTPQGPRYTVGFAGTDPTDVNDLITDGKQGLGLSDGQYRRALEIGNAVAAATNSRDGSHANVDFAGHSLGGGLAAAAAIASGKNADTFNAAGLHGNTIAAARALARSNHVAPGRVDNYRVQGEPLTAVSEVPGVRGLVGGTAGGLLGGIGGFVMGGPAGGMIGAGGGFVAGDLGGSNVPTPPAYGHQHDLPVAVPAGQRDLVVNRHTMGFVLASVRSQLP